MRSLVLSLLAPVLCGVAAAQAVTSSPPAAATPWAFRPLAGTPALQPAAIDRRIDDELRSHGLQRSAPADRRTLLRRASFALTGLPPSPAEVAAFVADPSPDAFARQLDRLLASPHYGEHMARAWLDLARYSDSNGLDENLAFGNAWRYRDWVVRAFQQDLPFDRFGSMQIAGDLLPAADEAARQDGLVATAFLALGPKMLAEQDKEKLVLDTVDEQVDLIGRTFLGLTIGCARCHDHKFDPVPTRDYYALAGILKSTTVFDNLDHVSRWVEAPLASKQQLEDRAQKQKLAEEAEKTLAEHKQQQLAALRRQLPAQLARLLLAGRELASVVIAQQAEAATSTSLTRDDAHWGSADCVVLHTGQGGPQYADYAVTIATAGRYRFDVRLASKEERPVRVLVDGQVQLDKALAVTTPDWFAKDQRWFAAGELQLAQGTHTLRLEGLAASMPHLDQWLLLPQAQANALPLDGGDAAARPQLPTSLVRNAMFAVRDASTELGRQFLALDGDDAARAAAFGDVPPPASVRELALRWQLQWTVAWTAWDEALAAAEASKQEAPKALPTASLEQLRLQLLAPGGLLDLDEQGMLQALPAAAAQQLADLTRARDAAKAAVPPPPPIAMCARESKPVDLPVHIRGNHLTLAKTAVPRGFLSVLAGQLPAPAIAPEHSGRVELAQWLFDARNPLTARVLANRVWLGLFGQGLSRSPSNFGVRGEKPSHPELLDELALSLQQDGWSMKRLQRRILLSQTWQQQSQDRAEAAQQDPQNRWLWRQHRRRLPAEAIRDAVLATAGTLDHTVGGNLLTTGDRDYVTNDQSNDQARYDAPRRSIYLPIIRNAMYDLFTAFDYADPSVHIEQRSTSAVAPQALLLMNSPFALQQSMAFAKAALAAATDEAARLDWIWQQALQRAPSDGERAAAHRYLDRATSTAGGKADEPGAWQGLCQTLLCTNEFVYVD